MNSDQVQSQGKIDDDGYLKIWQTEQEFTRTRWTIVTFFMSVSFAILGFSFQDKLASPKVLAIRIAGLFIYWFAYFLYLQFYEFTKALRAYLIEMETSSRTTHNIHGAAEKVPHIQKRIRTTRLLLYFGLIYTAGVILLWLLGL